MTIPYYVEIMGDMPLWTRQICSCYTCPETNSSPLKIGHPKRKSHLPTFDFQQLLFLVFGSVLGGSPQDWLAVGNNQWLISPPNWGNVPLAKSCKWTPRGVTKCLVILQVNQARVVHLVLCCWVWCGAC